MAFGGTKGRNSRTGPGLLREVYAELQFALGSSFSPKELLIAAQKLIEISSAEYSDSTFQDGISYPGYYSRDVDFMINHQPWCLVEYECNCLDFDEERYRDGYRAQQKLRQYYYPDTYFHRG